MKRVLSMVFVFMLFLVLQPISANAAPGGTDVSGDWSPGNLTDALYRLSSDATLKSNGTSSNQYGVTIDLNGHTLTIDNEIELITSYDLTIIDSSEAETGKIQGEGSVYVKNRTLKANSGTIASTVFVGQNGTVSVDSNHPGAKFTGAVTNNGTIDGGTFNGAVTNRNIIYDGTFYGTVQNGYETPGHTYVSSPGYRCYPGQISGGEFYGTVENPSFVDYEKKNVISGGWFYHSEPTGNVEYFAFGTYAIPVYKITYKSKNGTFLGMNFLPTTEDDNSVMPDYDYMPKDKTADTFDCWYTDPACTQKVDKESRVSVTKDTTLYGIAKETEVIEDPWDNPFEDVHEYDWFYNSVKFCHKRGWFNGKTKTLFAPYDTFTRAEISAVLYNRAGTPAVNTNRVLYVDVKEGAWYTRAVYWMTDRGNAVGANNHFYPDNPVTREEMATMLYNAAGRPETNGTLFQYLDKNDASDWANEALCWVVEKGIMIGDGDGTLRPRDNVTRAEAASIMRSFGIAGYGDYVATN